MNKAYITLGNNRKRIKDIADKKGIMALLLIFEEQGELIQAISKRERIDNFLKYKEMERLASTEKEWNNLTNGKKWNYLEAEEALKDVNRNINEEMDRI